MPLYEYQCESCPRRFEVIQKFSDAPIAVCPTCGGPVQKLLSSPAIQFKGSGFYLTDYGRGVGKPGDTHGGKGARAEGGKGGSESGGERKADGAADKGESKTGDSAPAGAATASAETASAKPAAAKTD